MKQFKTLLLAIALIIGSASVVNAQAKVAHVNTQDIMQTFPKSLSMQAEIKIMTENMLKNGDAQYNDMLKEYQKIASKYQTEATTQTATINESRKKELAEMQGQISNFERQIQVDIQTAQGKKMQPLQEQVMAAINKVANTLGYKYVFDKTSLIVANGTDITADVKKELGF